MLTWLFEGSAALWTLFFTGFLSATLLPGGSEANLTYMISQKTHAIWLVILVASIGNTFGGMANYYIGRCLPLAQVQSSWRKHALAWLRRYGYWSLLLSWVPLIGDPLCLMAGWLRFRQSLCWIIIFISKTGRYLVLAYAVTSLTSV